MAKTRKGLVYKRRQLVRKLYLQGLTKPEDIATNGEVNSQFGTVSISTIKTDLKAINKWYLSAVEKNPRILEKQAEYILKHLDQLNMVKNRLWDLENNASSDKDRIAALKAILEELSHEEKVLKLIDVSKTITQYIHVDKIGILVNDVIGVIKEFVPLEKQKYALQRLKGIGDKVIDVKSHGN